MRDTVFILALPVLLAASLGLSACTAAPRHASSTATHMADAPPGTGAIMRPPGDAERAIREQFAEAERRNSEAAYRLFAERHPGHALAREAERRIEHLHQKMPR